MSHVLTNRQKSLYNLLLCQFCAEELIYPFYGLCTDDLHVVIVVTIQEKNVDCASIRHITLNYTVCPHSNVCTTVSQVVVTRRQCERRYCCFTGCTCDDDLYETEPACTQYQSAYVLFRCYRQRC